MSKKVIIIGSGIAGISSSLKLKSYGINSIILDKGNFVGGRISTREIKIGSSSSYFFHGAQFFTAKTHEFKKIISTGVNGKYIKAKNAQCFPKIDDERKFLKISAAFSDNGRKFSINNCDILFIIFSK